MPLGIYLHSKVLIIEEVIGAIVDNEYTCRTEAIEIKGLTMPINAIYNHRPCSIILWLAFLEQFGS